MLNIANYFISYHKKCNYMIYMSYFLFEKNKIKILLKFLLLFQINLLL